MSDRADSRYAPIVLDAHSMPKPRRTGGIVTRHQAPKKGLFVRNAKHRAKELS